MVNDLSIPRGDDLILTHTLVDSDGAAVNITGYTFFFTIKETTDTRNDDNDAIISETVTSFASPTTGQAIISITAARMNVITPNNYKWDLQYKTVAGKIVTPYRGDIEINKDYTRRTS